MEQTVELLCSNPKCRKPFKKSLSYYKSSLKNGQRNFYCSIECGYAMVGKSHTEAIPCEIKVIY